MRLLSPVSIKVLSVGFVLSGTTALALPTDKGRSADVFANATRYFAATAQPVTPRLRPDDLIVVAEEAPVEGPTAEVAEVIASADEVIVEEQVAAAAVDVEADPVVEVVIEEEITIAEPAAVEAPVVADAVAAADVEAEATVQIAEVAAAEEATPVETVVADAVEESAIEDAGIDTVSADTVEPAVVGPVLTADQVASTDYPVGIDADEITLTPQELASVDVPLPLSPHDGAFEVSLTPRDVTTLAVPLPNADQTFDVANDPDAALTDAASADVDIAQADDVVEDGVDVDPTLAALDGTDETDTAGSSRPQATPVADVPEIEEDMPEDLLTQMADADSNFTVREGEGGEVDTMMMSSDVLFGFGKSELSSEAEATLTTMVDLAETVNKVEIFGHTDSIGNETNNLALGQKRAEAVRAWLLDHSEFAPEQIIATGVGETDPFVPNVTESGQDDPVGRAQNRRVEFAFE